jgi:YbgC/YbaW family acyl-CoA thioester hydrolase
MNEESLPVELQSDTREPSPSNPRSEPRNPQSFVARFPVRFSEVDLVGFVYYPRVLHYCHVAMEAFFAARCGTTYAQLLADERLGFATVNAQAEFFAPFNYGDEVEVEVFIARVGRSSATFEYRLRRASDGTLCARVTLVQVALNVDEHRAVEIPARYRAVFVAAHA